MLPKSRRAVTVHSFWLSRSFFFFINVGIVKVLARRSFLTLRSVTTSCCWTAVSACSRRTSRWYDGRAVVCSVSLLTALDTLLALGLAEAVEVGVGVGHLPCFVADVRPSLVRLSPPEPRFAADLWLLTHPDLRHSARVRVFLDFLAAEIAKRRKLIEGEEDHPGPAA